MTRQPTLPQIASRLTTTPAALRALLTPLPPAALTARAAAGDWSIRDVVIHLLTGDEPAFAGRIRFIIEQQGPQLPPFDPDAAVDAFAAGDASLDGLLQQLTVQREAHAAWLRSLNPALLVRTAQYEPHGTFTAWDFVYEWPYHDQAHLAQIGTLIRLQLLPGMSPAMRRALGH